MPREEMNLSRRLSESIDQFFEFNFSCLTFPGNKQAKTNRQGKTQVDHIGVGGESEFYYVTPHVEAMKEKYKQRPWGRQDIPFMPHHMGLPSACAQF